MSVRTALLGPAVAVLLALGLAAPAEAVTTPAALQRGAVDLDRLALPGLTATQTARLAQRRQARQQRVSRMLQIARNQRGDRYQYGAAGPHRFDCSGLVYFSSRKAGFRNVPRTSSQQGRFMRRIARKAMRPGDFVFFTGGSGVYHVGVYTGRRNGRRLIVHAPGSGQRVRTDPIWTNRWFAGTLR